MQIWGCLVFIYAISQYYHAQFYQLKCFYYITLSLFFSIKEIVYINHKPWRMYLQTNFVFCQLQVLYNILKITSVFMIVHFQITNIV